MAVQQGIPMTSEAVSRKLFNNIYPAYSHHQYPDQFNTSTHDDEDSSHSSIHRSSPINISPMPSNPDQTMSSQPLFKSFYKAMDNGYQAPQNYSDFHNQYKFQNLQKRDSDSPQSQHNDDSRHSDSGYVPQRASVNGGLVGPALDSEGSSLKSSSSDNGSYTSEGNLRPPSHSPPLHIDDHPHSPASSVHSNNEHHLDSKENIDVVSPEIPNNNQGSDEISQPKTPENPPRPSPSSEKSSSTKKKQCSPDLHKIEAVINNLRTAKAKKKVKKDSPVVPQPQVPTTMAGQHPMSDPRNVWAMYALSQYAMMAPNAQASTHYPYHQAEGAAAAMYSSHYQNMMHPNLAHSHLMNHPEAASSSPIKRKRPEEEYEEHQAKIQSTPSGAENQVPHHSPEENLRDQPLDFSKASTTPSPKPSDFHDSHNPGTSLYSPSQRKSRTRSPATKTKNRKLKEQVVTDHSSLWEELKELSLTLPTIKVIVDDYQKAVDEFETERYQALLDNIASDQCKDAVHAYFNHERLALIKKTRNQLSDIKRQSEVANKQLYAPQMMSHPPAAAPFSHSSSSPFTSISSPVNGTGNMATSYPYANALYGLASNVPPMSASVPNFGVHSPMASYMATAMADDAAALYGPNAEEPDNSSKRKFLTQEAVSVLQTWYDKNEEHPYPDEETVEELAREAGVTVPQVKKWMANKRVRSSNTLAFNGSIHPKKIQKLIQLKEMAESRPQPLSSPIAPQNLTPTASTPNNSRTKGSSSGKKNKRLLDPAAVAHMTRWYNEHIMYPYPTDEEKNQIAAECNLTISQVTCWFANKRNRSNHSRKHIGLDKTAISQKMTVYDSVKHEKMEDSHEQPQG